MAKITIDDLKTISSENIKLYIKTSDESLLPDVVQTYLNESVGYYHEYTDRLSRIYSLLNRLVVERFINESTQQQTLKVYRCEFAGLWPVGNCLILSAYNQQQAEEMARNIITHTNDIVVIEVVLDEPKVIEYISGDY